MLQSQIQSLREKLGDKVSCEMTPEIEQAAALILAEFPNHPNLANLKLKYAPGAGGGFAYHVDTSDLVDLLNQIPAKPETSQDIDRNGTAGSETIPDHAPPVSEAPESEPTAPEAPAQG